MNSDRKKRIKKVKKFMKGTHFLDPFGRDDPFGVDLNEVERLKEFVSEMSLEEMIREIICDFISTDEFQEIMKIRLKDYNVTEDYCMTRIWKCIEPIRDEICPDPE